MRDNRETQMAEIIDFAEIHEARRRARARVPQRENLERAVQLMRENLAAVAVEMAEAPHDEQAELLTRVERLAAMIRYGMRMLGDPVDASLNAGGQHWTKG
jgi:hypothetical protein